MLVLPAIAAVSLGAAPVLSFDVTEWRSEKSASLGATLTFSAPLDEVVTIGSPTTPWCQQVKLVVTGEDGKPRTWPWTLKVACKPQVTLSGNFRYGAAFEIASAAYAKLPPGLYEVSATFQGAQVPSVELLVGDEARLEKPPSNLPATIPALAAALRESPPLLRRRALEVALDGALATAPPLLPGKDTDDLIANHLADVFQAMCAETNPYDHSPMSYAPSDALLSEVRVLLFPGTPTPTFSRILRGRPLSARSGLRGMALEIEFVAAKTPAAFWETVADRKSVGLFVHPLREREGVVRVALTGVLPSRVEELTYVGFWARDDSGWKRLAFEPLSPKFEPRDWESNVHRPGPPSSKPKTRWPDELRSRVQNRLQLLELASSAPTNAPAGRTQADLHPFVNDLEAFRNHPNPKVRSEVLLTLVRSGKPVTLDELVGVTVSLKSESVPMAMIEAIRDASKARFEKAEQATTEERAAVVAAVTRHRRPDQRSLASAGISVRVVGELARADFGWFDEGSSYLLQRQGSDWRVVTSIGGWIH